MATGSRQLQSTAADVVSANIGLIANGSAGSWDIAVDETTSGADHWFLQIEGPAFDLYAAIPGPQRVATLLAFVEQPVSPGEIELGRFGAATVRLIRDDETAGRLFFVISGDGGCGARLTVSAADASDFIEALRQVRDGLADEGLLSQAP